MASTKTAEAERFERLYRSWWGAVRRTARSVLGSDEAAEDAAQQVFMRLWSSGRYRRIDNPASFFRRAALNEALSSLRSRTAAGVDRRAGHRLVDPAPLPDDELIWAERRAFVERMIGCLPERCGLVCRLVYLEGMSHAQVARSMGISPKMVGKHAARARRILRSISRAEAGGHMSSFEDGGGVARCGCVLILHGSRPGRPLAASPRS